MKDFKDFKDSIFNDKVNQIINLRIDKVKEFEKDMDFSSETDKMIWIQRNQTVGFIVDLLEEYHKWLNS